MIAWSLQECPRPEAFADDMEALFKVEAQIDGPEGIDVDKVSFKVLGLGLDLDSWAVVGCV